MAATIDGTSPIRFSDVATNNTPISSAPFTPPANSLLVVCVVGDTDQSDITVTVADQGAALTFTPQIVNNGSESGLTGPYAAIFTAPQVSSAARTIDVTRTTGGLNPARLSAKIYVVTGADLAGTPIDSVGANNKGSSTANVLTTASLTPGASGLLFVADGDWSGAGAAASSDLTADAVSYAGVIDVTDGWKAVTSGVGATGTIDATGTADASHKYAQIIVREVPGAATAVLSGTAIGGITEADIVAGSKTVIITLSGDTWIAS